MMVVAVQLLMDVDPAAAAALAEEALAEACDPSALLISVIRNNIIPLVG